MESNGKREPVLDARLCARCKRKPTDAYWCEVCYVKILEPWIPETSRQQESGNGGRAADARAASWKTTEEDDDDCDRWLTQELVYLAAEEQIVGDSFDKSIRQSRRRRRRDQEAASRPVARPKEGEVIDCDSPDPAVPSGDSEKEAQSTVFHSCALRKQAGSPSAHNGKGKELADEEAAPVRSAPAKSAPAAGGVQAGSPGACNGRGSACNDRGSAYNVGDKRKRISSPTNEQTVRRSPRLNIHKGVGHLQHQRDQAQDSSGVVDELQCQRNQANEWLRKTIEARMEVAGWSKRPLRAEVGLINSTWEDRRENYAPEYSLMEGSRIETDTPEELGAMHIASVKSCARRNVIYQGGMVERWGREVDGEKWGEKWDRVYPPEAGPNDEGFGTGPNYKRQEGCSKCGDKWVL
jgi:hypothetical protein